MAERASKCVTLMMLHREEILGSEVGGSVGGAPMGGLCVIDERGLWTWEDVESVLVRRSSAGMREEL